MLNTKDSRGNPLLGTASAVELYGPNNLLNQLKKAGISERLLHILHSFLSEKASSSRPDDRKYLFEFANEINTLLKEYSGSDLKIILMQRLIIFGVNPPQLVTYYYDTFVNVRQNIEPDKLKKLIARLIQKTEVAELYDRAYDQFPSLKESLQIQLYAWIKTVEKEEYGFYTAGENDLGPIMKLGVTPGVFMNIYRSMEETGLVQPLISHRKLFNYFSQTLISNSDKKIKYETLRNGFVYDNIKDLQKAKYILVKIIENLDDIHQRMLTR